MPTSEKVAVVEELRKRFTDVTTVMLTEYRGLTVRQLGELRRQLRTVSAEYKIVKNRLARLAVSSSDLDGLATHLTGPIGLVLSKHDPIAVAKAVASFARANQPLAVKAGYVEGQILPADALRSLADLPSKEALRGRIVGAVRGPLGQLVRLLGAPLYELVYVLAERGKGAAQSPLP